MKQDEQSNWLRAPLWKKRIGGFFSYLLFAVFSLYDPVAADAIMYRALDEQLKDFFK